jgi:hypothetical protein
MVARRRLRVSHASTPLANHSHILERSPGEIKSVSMDRRRFMTGQLWVLSVAAQGLEGR